MQNKSYQYYKNTGIVDEKSKSIKSYKGHVC